MAANQEHSNGMSHQPPPNLFACVRDEDDPEEALFDNLIRPWRPRIHHAVPGTWVRADYERVDPFLREVHMTMRRSYETASRWPEEIIIKDGSPTLKVAGGLSFSTGPGYHVFDFRACRSSSVLGLSRYCRGRSKLYVEVSARHENDCQDDDEMYEDHSPGSKTETTPSSYITLERRDLDVPFPIKDLPRELRAMIWHNILEDFFWEYPDRRECIFFDSSRVHLSYREVPERLTEAWHTQFNRGYGLLPELCPEVEQAYITFNKRTWAEIFEVRMGMSTITLQARCLPRPSDDADLKFPDICDLPEVALQHSNSVQILVPGLHDWVSDFQAEKMVVPALIKLLNNLHNFRSLRHVIFRFGLSDDSKDYQTAIFENVRNMGPKLTNALGSLVFRTRLHSITLEDVTSRRMESDILDRRFRGWKEGITTALKIDPRCFASLVNYQRNLGTLDIYPTHTWYEWLAARPEFLSLFPQRITERWSSRKASWLSWNGKAGEDDYPRKVEQTATKGDVIEEMSAPGADGSDGETEPGV